MTTSQISLSNLLKSSWQTFKNNALVFTALSVFATLSGMYTTDMGARMLTAESGYTLFAPATHNLFALVIAYIIWFFSYYFFTVLSVKAVYNTKLTENNFTFNFKNFLKFWATAAISLLIVSIGLFLLVVPGIIFLLALTFACYIVVDKPDTTIIQALKQSSLITKGHRWRLLGIIALFFAPLILMSVSLLFEFLQILVIPLFTICLAHMYKQLLESKNSAV